MPFSAEQLMGVFKSYNEGIFPFNYIIYLIGIVAFSGAFYQKRWINYLLAFLWVWIGAVFQFMYFSAISMVAAAFGIFFIVQGVLFVFLARRPMPVSEAPPIWRKAIGTLFVIYGMGIYEAIGPLFGHTYPAAPDFGVTCPTTIYTFGVLLVAYRRVHWVYLIIPLAISFLGMTAALKLGMTEDYALPVAGILGFILLMGGRQRSGSLVRPDYVKV